MVFKVHSTSDSVHQVVGFDEADKLVFRGPTVIGNLSDAESLMLGHAQAYALENEITPVKKHPCIEVAESMLALASEPCEFGYVPVSIETLREWARKITG